MALPSLPAGLDSPLAVFLQRLMDAIQGTGESNPISLDLADQLVPEEPPVETPPSPDLVIAPGSITQEMLAPGAVSLDKTARDLGVEAGGFAYGIDATFNTSGRRRTYRLITMPGDVVYTIQAGDYLEYDILFDAASVDTRGGVDLRKSIGDPPHLLRDVAPSLVDQEGVSIHPKTRLGDAANGRWYHRTVALPTSWVGKSLTAAAIGIEDPATNGRVAMTIKAIVITNGKDDTAKRLRYPIDRHTFSDFPVWTPYGTQEGVQTISARRIVLGHAVSTDNVVSAAVTRGGQATPADVSALDVTTAETELCRVTGFRATNRDSFRVNVVAIATAVGTSNGSLAGNVNVVLRLYRAKIGAQDFTDPLQMQKLDGKSAFVSWAASKAVTTFKIIRTLILTFLDTAGVTPGNDYVVTYEVTSSNATGASNSVTASNEQVLTRSA